MSESDDDSNAEPLTSRFWDLWGEIPALLALFGSIIRISEKAMFNERFREDLEAIRDLADEGLQQLDKQEEKPKQGFGFTRETEDGA